MDDLTITLLKPVIVDGETTSSLTLRELTVDEMILHEKQHGTKTTAEQDKFFFSMSCGVVPDVIGKLGSRDWNRLKSRYWSTLGNGMLEPSSSE
jgi:Phage tail assembly chaperone proteins, E, or 41 or 14